MITFQCDQTVRIDEPSQPGAARRPIKCPTKIVVSTLKDPELKDWWYAKKKGHVQTVYCPEHYQAVKGVVLI